MSGKGDLEVKVNKEEVMAAALPMQEHWLPQSNLDLLVAPDDVGVFFCYKKKPNSSGNTFDSMVSVLKKALAQTLVSYYALAGEIVQNVGGEPELLCNNRGVEFIEAFADMELQELNLYNPDETVEGKLLPTKKQGVLAIQATELKCGGLILGCNLIIESVMLIQLTCFSSHGDHRQVKYVMPMPSASGNGDWIVYMHLIKEQIESIETCASDVFKPMAIDCLS